MSKCGQFSLKVCLIVLGGIGLLIHGLDSLRAQKSAVTKYPIEHGSTSPTRPDKAISDLTSEIAGKLPKMGGAASISNRTIIDEHLFGAMQRDGIPHSSMANDYEFCRRVYLDLIGRIPTTEQLKSFVNNPAPDKRDKLIDELLDSSAWVDHWSYFYADLFRACGNRFGNPTLKHFDAWIRQSFRENKPYNKFVTEMLTASAPNTNWMPDAAPSGFLTRWHVTGATMYDDNYEDTADEIIVNTSRLFLGINYQCISCHGGKGFLEKMSLDLVSRKRQDFWKMSAFFGRMRMRVVPYEDRYTLTEDGDGYNSKAWSQVRLQREGGDVDVRPQRRPAHDGDARQGGRRRRRHRHP